MDKSGHNISIHVFALKLNALAQYIFQYFSMKFSGSTSNVELNFALNLLLGFLEKMEKKLAQPNSHFLGKLGWNFL